MDAIINAIKSLKIDADTKDMIEDKFESLQKQDNPENDGLKTMHNLVYAFDTINFED